MAGLDFLRSRRPGAVRGMWLLFYLVLGTVAILPQAQANRPGAVMLVGGVLSLKNPVVWQRIAELVGGEVVVIAAANHRPALYGNYAVRGLSRAGLSAHLLPIAPSANEFDRHHRDATRDPEIVARVLDSSAVFFVGGAPQRLAEVLFADDGSPTPLAAAITQLRAEGGLIIGGIPEHRGPYTGIDALQILERGSLPAEQLYRGLGLLAADWYVDQHLFVGDRLYESLVSMQQSQLDYGIGVAPDSAALIENGRLEVVGDAGVMLVNLSQAKTDADTGIFNLSGVRLSYLGDGDRIDLETARVTPHPDKLDGFEIRPGSADHAPMLVNRPASDEAQSRDQLVRHMLVSLDGKSKQALVYALRDDGGADLTGFRFRYHAADDTIGWLATTSVIARYTALNVHLDIQPLTQAQATRLSRQRRQSQDLQAPSVKSTE